MRYRGPMIDRVYDELLWFVKSNLALTRDANDCVRESELFVKFKEASKSPVQSGVAPLSVNAHTFGTALNRLIMVGGLECARVQRQGVSVLVGCHWRAPVPAAPVPRPLE